MDLPRPHHVGSGPARLVALHGFTQSGAMFEEFAARLGSTVVAPDLPGHGKATTTPATLATASRIVLAALSELGPPAPLLGYSMGGRLALAAALTYPQAVSALILVSAAPGLASNQARASRRAADASLADQIETWPIERFIDRWLSADLFEGLARRGPQWQSRDRRLRTANTPVGLAAALRGLGQGALPYLADRLSRLDVPALVVCGERDAPYRDIGESMVAAMPNATLRVINDVGHPVVGEAPERLAEAVGEFLGPI